MRYIATILFILQVFIAVNSSAADFADHPENVWVRQSPADGKPVPKFGWEGCGVFNPYNRTWIHQGGHDGIPQGFALFTFDLKSANWKQHFPDTSPPGVCCIDGSAAFDTANHKLVRFPAGSLGHGYQYSRSERLKESPVWLYDADLNSWSNMRPPPYKELAKYSKDKPGGLNAAATYDPLHEVTICMGGQGSGGSTNSLFVYDAYANNFEQLKGKTPPSERDGQGMVYDPKNDCLVVFGSQYAQDEKTWLYHYATNAWESLDLNPHPPAKKGKQYSTIPKMAYDTLNQFCLCITWDDVTGDHQTWALDVAARKWTQLNPSKEPDPSSSRSRNLDYSPAHNLFILELSAKQGTNRGPEIWTYRYKIQPPVSILPPEKVELITAPGKAALKWEAPKGGGVKEYRLYRAQSDKAWLANYAEIAATQKLEYQDTNMEAGKVYFYRIKSINADGKTSDFSTSVRTQLRVPEAPIVSLHSKSEIEIAWTPQKAPDFSGYNLYRGIVSVRAIKKGTPAAWQDNDPEYAEPQVVRVTDITGIKKLNSALLSDAKYTDKDLDLTVKGPESGEYKYAVYAYILRAVNSMGIESGPSPYALTLASEPRNVLLRKSGTKAEIKWDAARESGVTGYHVYKMRSNWEFFRITDTPVTTTSYSADVNNNEARFWIVPVDILGQEGQPSSPVWCNHGYRGFVEGDWQQ